MQAGGITVVSTYIFWIYHEENEGKFDLGQATATLPWPLSSRAKHGLPPASRGLGPGPTGRCGTADHAGLGPGRGAVRRAPGQ